MVIWLYALRLVWVGFHIVCGYGQKIRKKDRMTTGDLLMIVMVAICGLMPWIIIFGGKRK